MPGLGDVRAWRAVGTFGSGGGIGAGASIRVMIRRFSVLAIIVTTTVLAASVDDLGAGASSATSTTPSSTPAVTLTAVIATPSASEGWPVSTPEEHGVDSGLLADALLAIRDAIPNIHSVTIAGGGSLVLDAYFYPYDETSPHDVASVTKSITTTLVGIAIDQGVFALDDPVLSFFPDREIANRDEFKERMTIEHLASMTSGFACEAEPDEPTLAAMEGSEDYVQFALDLPMVAEPGTTFSYCSPGMHLLSAILTEATGMTESEFAQEYLFGPLGFGTVFWAEDPQGYSHGWGDAVIHPHDMAKLGQLFLNGGVWNGEQIVSETWIDDAVSVQASTASASTGYGFGWWVEQDPAAGGEFGAVGRGGQFITVLPQPGSVVVVTGGAADFDDAQVLELIAPAIVNPAGPLPPNPQAAAKLEATLETLLAQPEPQPFSLPETASAISGVRYLFGAGNPLGVESLQVTFDDSAEAGLDTTFAGGGDPFTGAIGLDGVFRTSPGTWDLPVGMRGTWTDGHTFVFERDEIANNGALIVTLRFDGDDVTVEVQERTVEGSVSITGTRSVEAG
jgi:CubicO group peptidase (beta-lactamase class C family)